MIKFLTAAAALSLALTGAALAGGEGGGRDISNPFLNPPPHCPPGGPVDWTPLLDDIQREINDIEPVARLSRALREFAWNSTPYSNYVDFGRRMSEPLPCD